MSPINFDFYNDEIVRRNSNCYTYALGSHWGFFPTRNGVIPGMYRAKMGDRPPISPNDLKARIIIDGLTPLQDPNCRNRANFSLPVPSAEHYLVAAFVGHYMGHWIPHFVRVDGVADNKIVEFSLRDGACVQGYEWAGDAWPDKMKIEEFRTGHYNDTFLYNFVGFFACPNAGIDLSVQKIMYDIHGSRPDALNNFGKDFIDANLEFFNVTNVLRSVDINNIELADWAIMEYFEAFEKYAKCWYGINMDAINDKIVKAYQKTSLAVADSQRVHELFAKNLSQFEREKLRAKKVY